MRYKGLRHQIREVRGAMGLSQAALASRSRTSRVTIARLENGADQDVRVGTLESLCAALDLELRAVPTGQLSALEGRLAREREHVRRLERRLAHARLAARLLGERAAKARQLVRAAQKVVDRWEDDRLCSEHYISRWRAKLSGPIARVAGSLLEHGEWEDALFQNTPWSFALGAPPE
jgi:transcriptional regulator with XRE-family HTH domain